MPKLTKSVVDKSPTRESQYTIWCSELKCFGPFIMPSGTRTYFVDYRNANNVPRRLNLGRPRAVTAHQPRPPPTLALADVAQGNHPRETRNQARKSAPGEGICQVSSNALCPGRLTRWGRR